MHYCSSLLMFFYFYVVYSSYSTIFAYCFHYRVLFWYLPVTLQHVQFYINFKSTTILCFVFFVFRNPFDLWCLFSINRGALCWCVGRNFIVKYFYFMFMTKHLTNLFLSIFVISPSVYVFWIFEIDLEYVFGRYLLSLFVYSLPIFLVCSGILLCNVSICGMTIFVGIECNLI